MGHHRGEATEVTREQIERANVLLARLDEIQAFAAVSNFACQDNDRPRLTVENTQSRGAHSITLTEDECNLMFAAIRAEITCLLKALGVCP